MKKERGITLVALVITIVVLIILAGTSISTLIGEEGIIQKAKEAKENMILAEEAEKEQLNQLYYGLEITGEGTEGEEAESQDEIIEQLQSQIEQKDIEIADLLNEVNDKQATIDSLQSQLDNLNTELEETTATEDKILKDYTAYSGGELLTGSMTNHGAVTSSLDCGASYTIPAGYHNGSGMVTANSLASQTVATADASKILSGYTAWVNGSKITGTASSTTDVSFHIKVTATAYYNERSDRVAGKFYYEADCKIVSGVLSLSNVSNNDWFVYGDAVAGTVEQNPKITNVEISNFKVI